MRSPSLPDVPTIAEAGVAGYEASAWYGVAVPLKTPPEIVAKLNRAFVGVLAMPEMRERIAQFGAAPAPGSPEAASAWLREEVAKWSKVVAFSGAKAQ